MSHGTQTNLAATKYPDLDANATPEVLTAASTVVYGVEADNSDNAVASYVELWDAAAAPSLGTDRPDFAFRLLAGQKRAFQLNGGKGATFATGVCVAAVTGYHGTAGPTNDVKVTVATD